ncbi:hypothetical protein B0G76_6825 [Paraburkholderia sp. BL23I1N1]|nr:hypothetical protein B0G76_6825 [Paraburkholderia sp. BL23I1N1]
MRHMGDRTPALAGTCGAKGGPGKKRPTGCFCGYFRPTLMNCVGPNGSILKPVTSLLIGW